MKLTRKQINDEIYRQFKNMILEQADQPGVGPYEKIKQLAELGKKIEQQIQNSLTHLNAFMNVGTKTEDSYEFKRAVAEIGRIQRLAADYSTVLVKAHEMAEEGAEAPADEPAGEPAPAPTEPNSLVEVKYYKAQPGHCRFCHKGTRMFAEFQFKNETIKDHICHSCDQLAKEVQKRLQTRVLEIDMKKANAMTAANKPPKTPKPELPTEDDAEMNIESKPPKGFSPTTRRLPPKRFTEGRMSDLAITIDELAEEMGTKDPSRIANALKRKPEYSKVPLDGLKKFASDWLGNSKQEAIKEMPLFGIVMRNRYDETIQAVDIKAKTMKEAALMAAQQHPAWEVKNIVVKEATDIFRVGQKVQTPEGKGTVSQPVKSFGDPVWVKFDNGKEQEVEPDDITVIVKESDEMGSRPDVEAFVSDAVRKKMRDDDILNTLEDKFGMSSMAADAALDSAKRNRSWKKEDVCPKCRSPFYDPEKRGVCPDCGALVMKKEMAQPDGSRADGGSGTMMDPNKSELQEEKLNCPDCKTTQLVRDPKTGKYLCANCKKKFSKSPELQSEQSEDELRKFLKMYQAEYVKLMQQKDYTAAKACGREIQRLEDKLSGENIKEEKVKALDSKGQEINIRDRVADEMWNPNTQKYEISRETFRVEKILSADKISVKDMQTGKTMTVNSKDVTRKGSTHAYEAAEEKTDWSGMREAANNLSKTKEQAKKYISLWNKAANSKKVVYAGGPTEYMSHAEGKDDKTAWILGQCVIQGSRVVLNHTNKFTGNPVPEWEDLNKHQKEDSQIHWLIAVGK